MFVSQSTLLLEYEYTYLIFVIFGLQATALFRPEKVRQKCVTSLQILRKWCLVGALDFVYRQP